VSRGAYATRGGPGRVRGRLSFYSHSKVILQSFIDLCATHGQRQAEGKFQDNKDKISQMADWYDWKNHESKTRSKDSGNEAKK